MDIQWPLALFTLLTAMGGCLFVFVGLNEFTKKSKVDGFNPALIAIVISVVGGICSVFHLEHVERIMNALSHPTSGIFIEAVLIGCLVVCIAIYLLCLKRDQQSAVKVFAVLGIVFGIALSFMAGHSYMMIAIPTWNTFLLPLGYLLTALPMGSTLYWALAGKDKEAGMFMAKCTVVCGALGFVGTIAYSIASGAFVGASAVVAIFAIILSGIVPTAIGYIALKGYQGDKSEEKEEPEKACAEAASDDKKTSEKAQDERSEDDKAPTEEESSSQADKNGTDKLKTEIWVAFASATVGALLYRVLMWMTYASVFGFFGNNF